MEYQAIIAKLQSMANPANVAGMARFGISSHNTLGISVAELRKNAKTIGRNHQRALELWRSGIHEARILAVLTDEPRLVTAEQMDAWAGDFDSWDTCDLCCIHLFRLTPFAHAKAGEWCSREEEFIRRAGFALIATLAVHDKKAADAVFIAYLQRIQKAASDERNFVKKAINWALRQIGKRNLYLNEKALETASEILQLDSKAARWIARDAVRELTDEKVRDRLKK
jgi:3-methyladenine DNA glycosylase AlkD